MIDLDGQATTPLAPEALAAMLPFLERQHWNPHSAHRGGRIAKAAVEAARIQVAELLGADPEGLVFTSGATEANALALKGLLAEAEGPRRRLVTFATEHSCVLESARHLQRLGTPVTVVPVLGDGMPDIAAFQAALGPDVALVSAMRVNNEIGSIWPSEAIGRMAHAAGALFHCDAAQGFGKIDCRLETADLVSLSAHKMHGPKGIGALWVRPGIALAPLLDGGGQEGVRSGTQPVGVRSGTQPVGVRSGTQSPALAAGFGAAARLAQARMGEDAAHCERLRLVALAALEGLAFRINGPAGADRWPGNLSLTFPGVDSSRLIAALPELAFSSGAACSSGSGRPSHVLAAIGLSGPDVRSTVRLGFGRASTEHEIGSAFQSIATTVRRMQKP